MTDDPRIQEFDQKLAYLKDDLGCEGMAFFVSDSKDVSRGDLAEEGSKHADAIISAVEGSEFRDATDLGM